MTCFSIISHGNFNICCSNIVFDTCSKFKISSMDFLSVILILNSPQKMSNIYFSRKSKKPVLKKKSCFLFEIVVGAESGESSRAF